MGAHYTERERTRARIIKYASPLLGLLQHLALNRHRYLKSIDKAYIQHYKRRRRGSEEGESESSGEDNEEEGEDESVDEEEEELNPDEELHIPEVEAEDETFDDWFEQYFPQLPEHRAAPGNRRRR